MKNLMEWVPVIWEAILAQSIIVESIRPTTIPTHYANMAESHFDNICSTEFNAARASNVLQDDLCKTLFCDHLCNKQREANLQQQCRKILTCGLLIGVQITFSCSEAVAMWRCDS